MNEENTQGPKATLNSVKCLIEVAFITGNSLFVHLKNNRKHMYIYNNVYNMLYVLLNFQPIPDRCKESGSNSGCHEVTVSSIPTFHSFVT